MSAIICFLVDGFTIFSGLTVFFIQKTYNKDDADDTFLGIKTYTALIVTLIGFMVYCYASILLIHYLQKYIFCLVLAITMEDLQHLLLRTATDIQNGRRNQILPTQTNSIALNLNRDDEEDGTQAPPVPPQQNENERPRRPRMTREEREKYEQERKDRLEKELNIPDFIYKFSNTFFKRVTGTKEKKLRKIFNRKDKNKGKADGSGSGSGSGKKDSADEGYTSGFSSSYISYDKSESKQDGGLSRKIEMVEAKSVVGYENFPERPDMEFRLPRTELSPRRKSKGNPGENQNTKDGVGGEGDDGGKFLRKSQSEKLGLFSKLKLRENENIIKENDQEKTVKSRQNRKKELLAGGQIAPRRGSLLQKKGMRKCTSLFNIADYNRGLHGLARANEERRRKEMEDPDNQEKTAHPESIKNKNNKKSEMKKKKKRRKKSKKESMKVDEVLCQVCFSNKADSVYMDCGHGGVCYECATQMWKNKEECYLCREVRKNSNLLKLQKSEKVKFLKFFEFFD